MSDTEYDVFLSFRGEDTRDNFTSHLYAELYRQNIETFKDDHSLDRGEEISQALYNAIEESKIYVIILSEHYASSSWCLDELTEILKCKERYGREVIPVFYKVDPSNVRHQRQSYADDLVKHHQRFGAKVDAWKAALTQVAGLSGWDSQVTRPESKLVTEIVKDIVKKLNRCVTNTSDCEGMTGIDNHIEEIQSLLLLDLPTVRMIGIWGMGGIGKTTIANAIFEKLATHFSSKSIIRNVQQEIVTFGLSHVKKEYLSQLLNETITSSESNSYDQRLKRTKGLIVFDDVKDADQLKDIIGTHHKFGQGSRIIVTSRNKQVLENANVDEIYQVREMNSQDSLKLFCSFAFKQKHPKESFVSLTEKVLGYAKGLPLALKVLGSMLSGKAKEVWESELQKLEKLPDDEIFRLLKLSYDGLDDEQKNIFLDIACFHIGELEKVVAQMLDCCGFSARIGMDVLEDRCLISISEGRVWMHDLIRDMGREIVRLQDKDDPGKRSRLWKASDIYDVLSKNMGKGTDAIRCIFLNMAEIKKVQLHVDTFEKMHHLRMINFYNGFRPNSNVTFHGFLKGFPNDLKLLQWDCFPQRSLPHNFCPENLVILDMRDSDLEQLWEGDQALPNLKRLDLRYSVKLRRLPDLSLCPNIEEVFLGGCVSLTQVYSSSFLNNLNLKVLTLDKTSIKELPSSLHHLVGLEKLSLRGCTKLKTIPSSIGNLSKLFKLDLDYCGSLETFPSSIFKLKLTELDFLGCSMLGTFPEIPNDIGHLSSLTKLSLRRSSIVNLPESMAHLSSLKSLNLSDCELLECVPNNIGRLSSLTELSLRGSSIVNLPESMARLSSLKSLNLSDCELLECVPKLPPNLNKVWAYDCPSIKRMMLNSRSDYEEDTFKFYLTNSEELDATSLSNIEEEACIKINDDAYRSVLFCFPGIAVPDWFSHRCQGHSITIRKDHLNLYGRNRLIGLALCVVLGPDFPYGTYYSTFFRYKLKFESDGQTHFHPNNKLEVGYYERFAQDHTFLWKYELDLATIGNGLIDAETITFEILETGSIGQTHFRPLSFPTTMTVKEFGICPLYSKENGDDNSIGRWNSP